MPMMKDATVLLHGVALQVEPKTKYQSDEPDGCVVMISGAGGLANVKIGERWLGSIPVPSVGEMVAMIVSPYAYAQQQGLGNMGYSFVRYATGADLDQIGASLLSDTVSAK